MNIELDEKEVKIIIGCLAQSMHNNFKYLHDNALLDIEDAKSKANTLDKIKIYLNMIRSISGTIDHIQNINNLYNKLAS